MTLRVLRRSKTELFCSRRLWFFFLETDTDQRTFDRMDLFVLPVVTYRYSFVRRMVIMILRLRLQTLGIFSISLAKSWCAAVQLRVPVCPRTDHIVWEERLVSCGSMVLM
jgi:hypothetical protein